MNSRTLPSADIRSRRALIIEALTDAVSLVRDGAVETISLTVCDDGVSMVTTASGLAGAPEPPPSREGEA